MNDATPSLLRLNSFAGSFATGSFSASFSMSIAAKKCPFGDVDAGPDKTFFFCHALACFELRC
jgi:hypothetical protein